MMTLSEFAARCGGALSSGLAEKSLTGFATDNREVQPGQVFLAIKGANVDGHDYASQAVQAGAVAVLSEQDLAVPMIRVANVVGALASFAKSKRAEFSGPVLGITGSNGKTSCKEFAAAALSPLGEVIKNPGNRNSEITSPLVWFDQSPQTQAMVIEMAMRGMGQIDHLARMHEPTLAIITMIGTAHLEMVGSREGIAQAKGEILDHLRPGGKAILWREDDFYAQLAQRAPDSISFGFSADADFQITGYRALGWSESEMLGRFHGESFRAVLPTVGKHQALNAAAALVAAVHCGVRLEDAAAALVKAELPPMRMEVRHWREKTFLLDNYNASPDSTVAALRTLAEIEPGKRKVAIIGEMKELGELSESGHRMVGKAVAQTTPDALVLFGEQTKFVQEEAIGLGLPANRICVARSLEDITQAILALPDQEVVLIKGSRALRMEDALEGLPE